MIKIFVSFVAFFMTSSLLFGAPVKITKDDVLKITTSSETQGNSAANIVDGDYFSRWESGWQKDPQWIAIELKDKKSIEAIKIKWENSAASVYKIESSSDGQKWNEILKVTDGKGNEYRTLKFKEPVNTKYIRIFAEQRVRENGYSIFEVEFNPIVISEKDKVGIKSAVVSSEQKEDGSDYSAGKAIDNDMNTRWSSEWSDPQWIKVELNEPTVIRFIKINWQDACGKTYKIQVSNDGTSWQEAAKITDGIPAEERIIAFKPVKARFVRIYGEQRNGEWGYSIFELGVYK